jgi:hypothetical protein
MQRRRHHLQGIPTLSHRLSVSTDHDAVMEAEFSERSTGARLRWQPFGQGRAIWQDLLASAPEATLYHRPAWIDLLGRAYQFSLWLGTLEQDGEVAAGCVMARTNNPFVRRFMALPFSDSCPPLAINGEASVDLLEALPAQAPSGTAYEIRGSRAPLPWQTVDCFASWKLHLDHASQGLERNLAANFRRNLRRASREAIGIEHGSGLEYLQRFYRMQLASRRSFGLPPQPWRFFRLVQETFSAGENFDVWIASKDGRDVAAAVFLRDRECIYYKWGARRADDHSGANHLLFWSAIEAYAGRAEFMDLGRTDLRNLGLSRFKHELGAFPVPLPYSFYPRAPEQISPEVLTGHRKQLARVWRRLPLVVTRMLGRAAYRFLA